MGLNFLKMRDQNHFLRVHGENQSAANILNLYKVECLYSHIFLNQTICFIRFLKEIVSQVRLLGSTQMQIRVQEMYMEVLAALTPVGERNETALDRGRSSQRP